MLAEVGIAVTAGMAFEINTGAECPVSIRHSGGGGEGPRSPGTYPVTGDGCYGRLCASDRVDAKACASVE